MCRVAGRSCALPLGSAIETLRALPVPRVEGAPEFVSLSIVRGEPVPVVHASRLIANSAHALARYVSVCVGERRAILAVGGEIETQTLAELPPRLGPSAEVVTRLGTLDVDLLHEVWRTSTGASS